ncbi:MAG: DUF1292 domain-containing protein [Finegoldia sp.]|nr:DUF1292 domain-containing protein [Finegoldia sp.]
MEIIKLEDENGIERDFQIVNTFGMDNLDYCVLEEVESGESLILRIKIQNDVINFESLDSKQELDDAIEVYNELITSQEEQL